jgi:hypothetical protein
VFKSTSIGRHPTASVGRAAFIRLRMNAGAACNSSVGSRAKVTCLVSRCLGMQQGPLREVAKVSGSAIHSDPRRRAKRSLGERS